MCEYTIVCFSILLWIDIWVIVVWAYYEQCCCEIFLIISDIEYIFMCLLAVPPYEFFCSTLLPVFGFGFFLFPVFICRNFKKYIPRHYTCFGYIYWFICVPPIFGFMVVLCGQIYLPFSLYLCFCVLLRNLLLVWHHKAIYFYLKFILL